MKAADDAAVRPEFLRALLDSRICVIGRVGDHAPKVAGSFIANEGDTLHLQSMLFEGRAVTPLFSSPERVAEYAPGATYVEITTRELLEMIGAQELILNPGSAYGKHLLHEEVASLLDGSAFQPRDRWVAKQETELLIGRPARYPQHLVEALRTMFARRGDVRRAYLALICIPSRNPEPNLYLAIETDGDLSAIAADCGIVAADTLEKGKYTDIGSTAIAADYFARDTPIYSRD